ncbi:hypothetical protein QR680_017654 [Steinernema hermaphroditum]|uniref:Uncharacterized protein n=1 Tax=Steinernema hermaphroditum TaxID=289476 RepID=A0AA39HFC4_9BILA|nr:hypothetical protein QR680_017654 [Steinernema hermaphroditum]
MNAELRDRMAELFAASRQVEAVCAEKEALELENADLRAELQKIREEKKDGLPLKNPEKVDFYKALLKERRKQLEEAVEESARLRRIVDEASGKASGSEPEEKGDSRRRRSLSSRN